jgi:hypothetical protein
MTLVNRYQLIVNICCMSYIIDQISSTAWLLAPRKSSAFRKYEDFVKLIEKSEN